MSYLVRNKKAVARTAEKQISGKHVKISTELCREEIDANRDYNLVNYKTAKISNSKIYDKLDELGYITNKDVK